MSYTVKDNGTRVQYNSGMCRESSEGKTEFWRVLIGPMVKRWADHVTKATQKYPDVSPGVPNWTLAESEEEYHRFRDSAVRHFVLWYQGDTSEDHAAAVMFNVNGAEYVKEKLDSHDVIAVAEENKKAGIDRLRAWAHEFGSWLLRVHIGESFDWVGLAHIEFRDMHMPEGYGTTFILPAGEDDPVEAKTPEECQALDEAKKRVEQDPTVYEAPLLVRRRYNHRGEIREFTYVKLDIIAPDGTRIPIAKRVGEERVVPCSL